MFGIIITAAVQLQRSGNILEEIEKSDTGE
jgi:hypothetical protein